MDSRAYSLYAKRGMSQVPCPKGFYLKTPCLDDIRLLLSEVSGRECGQWFWPGTPNKVVGVVTKMSNGCYKLVAHGSRIWPNYLHAVCVHPNFRRRGLARFIVGELCPLNPTPFLLAPTDPDTTAEGHAFWRALGFTEIVS